MDLRLDPSLNLDVRNAKILKKKIKRTIKRQMDELANLVAEENSDDENDLDQKAEEIYIDDDENLDQKLLEIQRRKDLIKFNKKLTKTHLMQSDLADGNEDPSYKDKVAECMEMRAKKIIAKLPAENK